LDAAVGVKANVTDDAANEVIVLLFQRAQFLADQHLHKTIPMSPVRV
jgi:hypothetical protein